ncbi:hypothetical protein QDY71_03645 [Kingella negevensis]|nr:hypothetical protein [Kingella negevensis]MDK4679707.1 hypothetical protein [Kingella negevensis]MDK4682574.1 hypothetical protein [Kingella negevensis]MDK4690771.1 hypothetical protein [Kingella negevensis]MDK4694081.1 hypothetical protein [Kingella negevensis]MDK4696863.1 hypothetical protein [Kingella negevensis]
MIKDEMGKARQVLGDKKDECETRHFFRLLFNVRQNFCNGTSAAR